MVPGLERIFEEQVQFRLSDNTLVTGSVYIGKKELLPAEMLREDRDAYRTEFSTWFHEVWVPEQAELREEILSFHANEKRYSDLRIAVERGQTVPFVGSGMSAPSGLPIWSDLLRRIRIFTGAEEDVLEDLIHSSKFEEAADLLAENTNTRLLDERIEHDLRIDDASCIDGAIRLLPAVFPSLVITTNLDDVLENVYDLNAMTFKYILAGKDLARYRALKSADQRFLLKLHGDCRDAESRVLLTAEYENAYRPGNDIREELTLLYRLNSLLFLGCSLGSDRTLRLVREVSEADPNMPKHYAFLGVPEDGNLLERERFLTKVGIYPIWYEWDHDESIQALLTGLVSVEAVAKA